MSVYHCHVEVNEIFSNNLIRFRKRKGFSLRELASITGISYRMIFHYEKNPVSVPLTNLKKLAETLNVNISDFFDESSKRSDITDIDVRWIKKIKEIQALPESDIKEINHHISSAVEKAKLKEQILKSK